MDDLSKYENIDHILEISGMSYRSLYPTDEIKRIAKEHQIQFDRKMKDQIYEAITNGEIPTYEDGCKLMKCLQEPTATGKDIDRLAEIPTRTPWVPTEQDYRECCGVWIHKNWPDDRHHTTPDGLAEYYPSRKEFDRLHTINPWKIIEPIPEQCIPRPVVEPVRESYNCPFPMLAGIDVEPKGSVCIDWEAPKPERYKCAYPLLSGDVEQNDGNLKEVKSEGLKNLKKMFDGIITNVTVNALLAEFDWVKVGENLR